MASGDRCRRRFGPGPAVRLADRARTEPGAELIARLRGPNIITSRVAVIGDVGGHSAELRRNLEDLGVGFDPKTEVTGAAWQDVDIDWPDGLHVVQVGDLVHRGPDSLGVVLLADRLIGLGVWTQVVGNHEQQYVDTPRFDWPETIDPEASDLLREWWGDGRMSAAAVLETEADDAWLITHAGLTAGFWEHGLGRPTTTDSLLAALTEARNDGVLWHPGRMLTGDVDRNAGPVWAEAGFEVYPSWLDVDALMPFHQIHGHSTAYWWDRRAWRCDRRVRRYAIADERTRHVTFDLRGGRIVGIDPGHALDPAPAHAPLLIEDAIVRTR